MSTQFMVTVTGLNSPGLVKQLAEKTHQNGGSWLNSKIVHLGGIFAGIIQIDVPETAADKLKSELERLDNIQITFSEPSATMPQPAQLMEMTFEANNRPGIIKDITGLLTDNGISIENMSCHRFNVSSLGETVFRGNFSLLIPVELDKKSLIEELEALNNNGTRVVLEAAASA